tara:strand:- start:16894 stop:17364 length:471 start_codon:yes stop_codon:yes gene_type:complete
MTYIPSPPQTYKGNQIILNSDRLLFNAKSDSILLFSSKAIGFSTNGSFHFDTSPDKNTSKFIINSPNIYLGLDDNNLPTQPAVLADDLIVSLTDILRMIENVYADIAFQVSYLSTTEGALTGPNVKNVRLLQKRQREITKKIENLEDIKSKNTKLV